MKFDGQIIQTLRKPRGLSQDGLARLAGVSTDTVQRAETGQNVPSAENLARIAGALGVPLEAFFVPNGEEAA